MRNELRMPSANAQRRIVHRSWHCVSLAGCSPKDRRQHPDVGRDGQQCDADARRSGRTSAFTLSRSPNSTRRSIPPASVDFDNDQATSVLAPFSGPVSRLLVSLGEHVKKGQALATVDSPDFAAAIGAYRKAIATAEDRPPGLPTWTRISSSINGVSQREAEQAQTDAANAEADRDAALQALVSLNVDPQTIKDIQEDGRFRASKARSARRSPEPSSRNSSRPDELLQAGTTPCFTVADLSRVWVMAQIFGSDLASVSVGDHSRSRDRLRLENACPERWTTSRRWSIPTRARWCVRVVVDNPDGF